MTSTTAAWRVRSVVFSAAKRAIRQEALVTVHPCFLFKEHGCIGGTRAFSSSSPNNDNDQSSDSSLKKRVYDVVLSPQVQFYGLVAGGSLGAYLISKVVMKFTGFFTHLTPTVIAKWGFYTGFGTASVLGGMALVTVDNVYIRADPVYRYCHDWVVGDASVQAALGDGLEAGNLRSYRLDSGRVELDASNNPVWRPPRIQMIFDVTATGPPYRTGLVTCEAIKSGGFPPRLHTTLLKVDYETGNEGEGGTVEDDQTIFLKGSEEELKRVSRRSGLSLEMLAGSVHINRAAAQAKQTATEGK